MKISLNWLRDFVDLPAKINAQEFAHTFTLKSAEVEHVEEQGKGLEGVIVGEILKIDKHPNADKLNVAKVDVGKDKPIQLIFGQMVKMEVGKRVPIAVAPTTLPSGLKIEAKDLRGTRSEGMLCLEQELGFKDEGVSILYFPDTKPGTPLVEAYNLDDIILDIDNKSLTHRPDLWGHYGIARETAALTGKKLKPYKSKVEYPKNDKNLSIKVENPKLCPRYIGVLMEGIKIEPSPDWMQKRLAAIGYKTINNIVDATNYVMAELGQPMHAFDADKIEGGIVVRTAKSGETVQTIDKTKCKLTKDMLVIADHKKPIAVAGVMGGLDSEITGGIEDALGSNSTTKIILESANFNPSSVRKTSATLNIRTEAVQRFEKSLDPHMAGQAMDKLCELILEMCPTAKIVSSKIDIKNFDEKPQIVEIDMKRIRSKIGVNIPTKKAIEILTSLEFKILKEKDDKLEVEIPSFRATKDVSIEDDLTEEIARLYGYENIEPKLPDLPTKLPEENTERKLKHRAREILSKGLGMNEVYNYSFYSQKDIQKSMLPKEPHINVDNYLSEDQTHLRLSLVPNMLKNVALNAKNYTEFRIYEIGRTYEDLQEYFPIEEKKICGIIVKEKSDKQDIFFEAKGALESLLEFFQTQGLEIRKGEALCPFAHPNKYAAYHLKKDDTEIARVYELHPLIAKNYNIENLKIAIFEVNFTKLAQLGAKQSKYKHIPRFPRIELDISVLIDETVTIANMQNQIRNIDKNLIKKVNLFDLYQGTGIPENKKSCAFKIIMQSTDRTLTDEDMKKVQQEAFKRLQKLGGEIRGLK